MLLFTRPSVFSCSKKMPYPPRTTVVLPNGRQAKPKRGPNCVVSVLVIERGSPAWLLVWMKLRKSA